MTMDGRAGRNELVGGLQLRMPVVSGIGRITFMIAEEENARDWATSDRVIITA